MRGAGFLLMFTLFWSGIVSVFDGFLIYGAVRQARADSYPSVVGEITRSEITTHRDSEGDTTYGADIEFTYRVDGASYTSDRYRYGEMSSSDRSMASGVVNAHPVGANVAVYYNPGDPADAILRPGIEGQDLMLALFLTPFNVVMLALWTGLAGAARRRITRPPAGGAPIVRRGGRVFVRLPRISPVAAGAAAALGISFVAIFAVAFGFGFDPPVRVVTGVWMVVLAAAIGVYFWRKLVVGSGAKDLIIDTDAGMLSLPQTFGRKTDIVVALDAVSGIDVERIVHHGSKGSTSYSYAPRLNWNSDDGAVESGRLVEWWDADRAEELAGWLRGQLGAG
jgi:hypothetical protein